MSHFDITLEGTFSLGPGSPGGGGGEARFISLSASIYEIQEGASVLIVATTTRPFSVPTVVPITLDLVTSTATEGDDFEWRNGAAWFTLGRENKARVQVSFSTDGGESFDAPRVLSKGDTDGFVSAAMDDAGTLWVTWLERPSRDVAAWMLAPLSVETLGEIRVLAETKPGRAAGMARLARDDEGLVFAWLDGEGEPRLRVWRLPDSRASD